MCASAPRESFKHSLLCNLCKTLLHMYHTSRCVDQSKSGVPWSFQDDTHLDEQRNGSVGLHRVLQIRLLLGAHHKVGSLSSRTAVACEQVDHDTHELHESFQRWLDGVGRAQHA